PRQVTLLNVLEDQLDRFVDPALVRDMLATVASRTTDAVILNADDQNILQINKSIETKNASWFGIAKELIDSTTHGLGSAPTYLENLDRPITDSEAESLTGKSISARIGGKKVTFDLPNRGMHYVLDAIAALESARRYLGSEFNLEMAASTISNLPPVFARGEVTKVNGVDVEFILVQNPMSFQLNLDNLPKDQEQLMVAIGRDVHDPSWLWTVDFRNLPPVQIVSGFNFAEIGLRLAYAGIPVEKVVPELLEAVDEFFAQPAPSQGRRTVIFSADAMRRTRRHLGFTSPDAVGQE
ncbi:MAG: MurT ligase domain-containing protein, partial [Rhodoluna sp.]